MKKYRYFTYGALLSFAIFSYPAQASFKCAPVKTAVQSLLSRGYGFLATGEIDGGAGIMFFTDRRGNFIILGVDQNLNACEIIKGNNLRFILGGQA